MSQSKQLNHTKSQDNFINVGLERFQKVRSSWTTCNNKVQNNSSEVVSFILCFLFIFDERIHLLLNRLLKPLILKILLKDYLVKIVTVHCHVPYH